MRTSTAKDEATGRLVEVLVMAVLVIILAAWLVGWVPQWWLAGRSGETDFALYYLAGWRLRLGLSPYEDLLSVKHQAGLPAEFAWLPELAFVGNPPLLLHLLLPLTFLPYSVSWLLWSAISALSLGLALLMLWRAFIPSLSPTRQIIGVLLILNFSPWLSHMRWGRTEAVILLILVGSLVSLSNGRDAAAGALAGLAASLRLYPGLFLLYFVVTRRWKSLAAMAGTGLLLFILSLIPRGLADYQMLFSQALPVLDDQWRSAGTSFSLPSTVARLRWAGLSIPTPVLYGLQALLVVMALSACHRTPKQPALGYGLIVITALLLSPITWYHSFILLVIPMLVAVPSALSVPALRLALAVIYMACSYAMPQPLFITLCSAVGPLYASLLSMGPFYGLLALYVVLMMLLWRPPSVSGARHASPREGRS